jgi:eukaryotic-like serine/threonine-protein kinase
MSLLSSLKIGKKIGEGCFGEVFEATEDVCGDLAVKIVQRGTKESDSEWLQRSEDLLKEGQRLQSATHPNVVRVMQIARSPTGESVHLALEYCEGGSLADAYASGPMPLDRVRLVIVDVCNGLHAIHARGMLHRDIKPSNILSSNGNYKIGDFGFVTDHDVFGYASAQGYTPNVAPEVFSTHRTSTASDIWALGMLVYRLLHGEPFCSNFENGLGDVVAAVMSVGFSQRIPWLPHIPDKWRRAVRRALNHDADKRFRDPIQFAQAFQSHPLGSPWECTWAPEKVTWTRKRAGRHLTVVREVSSARRHQWEAISDGLKGGRRFTLGKSIGVIKASQCTEELELFFRKHK